MVHHVTIQTKGKSQKKDVLGHGIWLNKCPGDEYLHFGGECEACEEKDNNLQRQAGNRHGQSYVPPMVQQPCDSSEQSSSQRDQKHVRSYFDHSFARVPVHTKRVIISQQQVGFEAEDLIHQPLIENYRRATGQPQSGIDETGQQMGPSDAELKYSGVLGRVGSGARWLTPVINRRNAAEVYFNSTPLIDPPGGLTTQFINEQEVHDNLAVERAVPRPSTQARNENGRTFCWFSRGVTVSGRTTMDIFAPGPWNFQITGSQAADRFGSTKCQGRSNPTMIHVDGHSSDDALEEFVRLGELEHETDSERSFLNTIAFYASNVNNLVGDTPRTRMSGTNVAECNTKLRQLENRDLLTGFVHQLNAATARRHAGNRHSSGITGLQISSNCSNVTVDMDAGRL